MHDKYSERFSASIDSTVFLLVFLVFFSVSSSARGAEEVVFECVLGTSHLLTESEKRVSVDNSGNLNPRFYLKVDEQGVAYKRNPVTSYNSNGEWKRIAILVNENSFTFIEALSEPVAGFSSNGVMMMTVFFNGFLLADKHVTTDLVSIKQNYKTGWHGTCR